MRFGTKPKLSLQLPNHLSLRVINHLIPNRLRIIYLMCIAYALRPQLSSRLTLGGRTWPRNPWVYGDRNSHPVYRYSCPHSHWQALHRPFQSGFAALVTLSYRSTAAYRC